MFMWSRRQNQASLPSSLQIRGSLRDKMISWEDDMKHRFVVYGMMGPLEAQIPPKFLPPVSEEKYCVYHWQRGREGVSMS